MITWFKDDLKCNLMQVSLTITPDNTLNRISAACKLNYFSKSLILILFLICKQFQKQMLPKIFTCQNKISSIQKYKSSKWVRFSEYALIYVLSICLFVLALRLRYMLNCYLPFDDVDVLYVLVNCMAMIGWHPTLNQFM